MKTMYTAIILAAGDGTRSALPNKSWHAIAGKSLVEHCVAVFENDERCAEIIVVAKAEDIKTQAACFHERVDAWVEGGPTRTDSAKAGVEAAHMPHVLVHDAARPALTNTLVGRIVERLVDTDAVAPLVALGDTLKRLDDAGHIVEDVDRDRLFALQTPQGFKREKLLQAYRKASSAHTCDVTLFRAVEGGMVAFVEGESRNIKLTTSSDVEVLEAILHDAHRKEH